jgi:uncharacterized protein
VKLADILKDYQTLPEYISLRLVDVNQVSLFGDRPINVAATRGSIEEMKVLINYGACINNVGEHGYTTLHNAVEQGQLNAVLWLLAHGADRNLRNDAGETPAALARALGEEGIALILDARAD